MALKESGGKNIWELGGPSPGHMGAGEFQIDLGQHPEVSEAQAFGLQVGL